MCPPDLAVWRRPHPPPYLRLPQPPTPPHSALSYRFGVMMVHVGDADGMVSGATHTTASTVRPAMQVGGKGGE